jgi:hypothetical protein
VKCLTTWRLMDLFSQHSIKQIHERTRVQPTQAVDTVSAAGQLVDSPVGPRNPCGPSLYLNCGIPSRALPHTLPVYLCMFAIQVLVSVQWNYGVTPTRPSKKSSQKCCAIMRAYTMCLIRAREGGWRQSFRFNCFYTTECDGQ